MSSSLLKFHIPLLFRNIVLRLLLLSSLASLLTQIIVNIFQIGAGFPPSALFWVEGIFIQIIIIVHHTFRKYWLNICEVLFSLAEAITTCYFLAPAVPRTAQNVEAGLPSGTSRSLTIFNGEIISTALLVFVLTALLFLLYDILKDYRGSMLRPYDYSAGLCPPGREWTYICGRFVARKRFSTDIPFIRYARGVFAFLCFFAVSALVIYALILQPLEWSGRQGTKMSKLSVDGDLKDALSTATRTTTDTDLPLQFVLTASNIPTSYPGTVTLTQTLGGQSTNSDCANSTNSSGAFIVKCSHALLPLEFEITIETLITIDFPEILDGTRAYLGMTNSTDDILAGVQPIAVIPGSNLYGLSSISVKERILNHQAATLGIPQYRRFAVIKTPSLFPDPSPSLPRGNSTFTLRIRMQSQLYIEVEQEYIESSVINGFALVGGVWTLVNGTFAAIFGSTLLLVLFGIKPLSIYGLVHLFRPGRGSLADGGYTLSPEERDRIVKILREHLLDVEGDEKDGTSSSCYRPVNTLPQSSCARGKCEMPA